MTARILKEVNAPYTINTEDEAVGRDTIIVRREGKPIAVVLPYAEYEALTAQRTSSTYSIFERERAAFQRLLPELLKSHRGEWVAIVDEQVVEFGPDFSSVIVPVRQRFGQRPVYIHEISEQPHIYQIASPHISRR